MVKSGADPGVGNTGHIPPNPLNQVVTSFTSGLYFVQRIQKMYKISGDLAIFSITRELLFFALVSLLSIMRCQSGCGQSLAHAHLVKFPPPLIAPNPPLEITNNMTHAQTVDTSPRREEPGDEASP